MFVSTSNDPSYVLGNVIPTGESEEKALSWKLQRGGAEGNVRVSGALSVKAVMEKLPPHSMGDELTRDNAEEEAEVEGW